MHITPVNVSGVLLSFCTVEFPTMRLLTLMFNKPFPNTNPRLLRQLYSQQNDKHPPLLQQTNNFSPLTQSHPPYQSQAPPFRFLSSRLTLENNGGSLSKRIFLLPFSSGGTNAAVGITSNSDFGDLGRDMIRVMRVTPFVPCHQTEYHSHIRRLQYLNLSWKNISPGVFHRRSHRYKLCLLSRGSGRFASWNARDAFVFVSKQLIVPP